MTDEPLPAEERAEQIKRRDKAAAKVIDDIVARLSDQHYSSDYLAAEGAKNVPVHFLGTALARLRKKLTREFLRDLYSVTARGEDRADALEREVAALKASVARGFRLRGTFLPEAVYAALDVVALDGGSFIARRDNPGPCPGDGWQLLVQRGKPGRDGKHTKRG